MLFNPLPTTSGKFRVMWSEIHWYCFSGNQENRFQNVRSRFGASVCYQKFCVHPCCSLVYEFWLANLENAIDRVSCWLRNLASGPWQHSLPQSAGYLTHLPPIRITAAVITRRNQGPCMMRSFSAFFARNA